MKRDRSKRNEERIGLLTCFFLSLGTMGTVKWLICSTSESGLQVDGQAVPNLLADSTQDPLPRGRVKDSQGSGH